MAYFFGSDAFLAVLEKHHGLSVCHSVKYDHATAGIRSPNAALLRDERQPLWQGKRGFRSASRRAGETVRSRCQSVTRKRIVPRHATVMGLSLRSGLPARVHDSSGENSIAQCVRSAPLIVPLIAKLRSLIRPRRLVRLGRRSKLWFAFDRRILTRAIIGCPIGNTAIVERRIV